MGEPAISVTESGMPMVNQVASTFMQILVVVHLMSTLPFRSSMRGMWKRLISALLPTMMAGFGFGFGELSKHFGRYRKQDVFRIFFFQEMKQKKQRKPIKPTKIPLN